MSDTLVVNEIYLSLQGESTFAGLPCVFVRLTACNLRCSYCDTAYAFTEGKKKSLGEVRAKVHRLARPFHGKRIPLAPGFSPVLTNCEDHSRFSGFPSMPDKAVETARNSLALPNTRLKPGANESFESERDCIVSAQH